MGAPASSGDHPKPAPHARGAAVALGPGEPQASAASEKPAGPASAALEGPAVPASAAPEEPAEPASAAPEEPAEPASVAPEAPAGPASAASEPAEPASVAPEAPAGPASAASETAAAARPSFFAVFDGEGLVGAFSSLDAAREALAVFPPRPLAASQHPRQDLRSESVWALPYRGGPSRALACVADVRAEAEAAQRALYPLGLVDGDSLDFWRQPFGVVVPSAAKRLAAGPWVDPEPIEQCLFFGEPGLEETGAPPFAHVLGAGAPPSTFARAGGPRPTGLAARV